MKKFVQNCMLAVLMLAVMGLNTAFAQSNPFANPYAAGILPAVTPLKIQETTRITMTLGNNGASPIPAGGAIFNISFTANILPDLASLFLDGGPFTVTSFVDEGVTYVQLTVSGAGIPAKTGPGVKTTYYVTIDVKGVSVGGPTDLILNAVNEPSIAQNLNSGDDNAISPIEVIENFPVKLVSFSAIEEGQTARLSWATTEEINADYFDIQRSANAKDWISIGQQQAAGESKALVKYTFTDTKPLTASNYYRLKMVDKDNTFAFSSIKSLKFDTNAQSLSFYPNPASNVLFLKNAAGGPIESKNVKEVEIMNVNGITSYKATSISADGINVINLSNGMYVVKVTKTDGTHSIHKVVINK